MSAILRSTVPGAIVATFAGCIASNVVATTDRMVATPVHELAFAPAPDLVLDGLFGSTELTGEAAVSLRRIWYLFRPDGTYTAAALVDADGVASFQTLSGVWANGPDGLSLDGAPPVQLHRAGDHLRITDRNGVVVLRREALQ